MMKYWLILLSIIYQVHGQCSSDLTISSTTTNAINLTSPNYPHAYPSNSDCTWIITASESNTRTRISFEIIELVGCCDVITIYDGDTTSNLQVVTLVGTYSSTNLPTYESTGSSLLVHFSSDSSLENTGFRFIYTALNQNFPNCVNTLPAYTTLNVSSSVQYFNSHPGYGSAYSNDYDVYWIMIKDGDSDTVKFTLTKFSVESSSSCVYDYLKVYDGPCTTYSLLYTFCGSEVKGSSYSHTYGKYLLFYFHTDNKITNKGFRISYEYDSGSKDGDGGFDKNLLFLLIPVSVFASVIIIKLKQNSKKRVTNVKKESKETSKQPNPQDLKRTQEDQHTKTQSIATTGTMTSPQLRRSKILFVAMYTDEESPYNDEELNKYQNSKLNESILQNIDFGDFQNLQTMDTAFPLLEVPKKRKKLMSIEPMYGQEVDGHDPPLSITQLTVKIPPKQNNDKDMDKNDIA